MKKILLSLFTLVVSISAIAQRNIDIKSTIVGPAANTTFTIGVPFTLNYVFKIESGASFTTTDTLFYTDPTTPSGQVYFKTGLTKGVNDTFQINRTYTATNATNGNIYWCVRAVANNRSNQFTETDTTDNRDCRTFIMAGGTSGIADLVFAQEVEKAQLNVFPNPAQAEVSLDFTAKNNSEVVIKVVDLTGRVLQQVNTGKAYQGKTGYKINVANLPTGLYMIEASQEGYKAVGKLSKN